MRLISKIRLFFYSPKYDLGSHWGFGGIEIFIINIKKNYKSGSVDYTICYTNKEKFNYNIVAEEILTIILEGIAHTAYGKLKFKK